MGSQVITRPGPVAAPLDLDLGASDTLTPQSAFARYDGSGAAGDFLPALTYYTQDGAVFARALGLPVTAGEVADVSFFPGLSAPASSKASGGGITVSSEQVNQQAVPTSIANSTTTILLPSTNLSGPINFVASGGGMDCLVAGLYSVECTFQLRTTPWTAGGGYTAELAVSSYSIAPTSWVTFPNASADPKFPQAIEVAVYLPPLIYAPGDKFFPIVTNLDGVAARSFAVQLCSIVAYA